MPLSFIAIVQRKTVKKKRRLLQGQTFPPSISLYWPVKGSLYLRLRSCQNSKRIKVLLGFFFSPSLAEMDYRCTQNGYRCHLIYCIIRHCPGSSEVRPALAVHDARTSVSQIKTSDIYVIVLIFVVVVAFLISWKENNGQQRQVINT